MTITTFFHTFLLVFLTDMKTIKTVKEKSANHSTGIKSPFIPNFKKNFFLFYNCDIE